MVKKDDMIPNDEIIQASLMQMPKLLDAINEIFDLAESKNLLAFRAGISNEAIMKNKKFYDNISDAATQQFANIFTWLLNHRVDDSNVRRSLELYTYGLFWENSAVLRLFKSMVYIVSEEKFARHQLFDLQHKTERDIRAIIRKARDNKLEIADVLDALYYKEIRDAAMHSQIFIDKVNNEIWLLSQSKRSPIIPISFDIWNRLFDETRKFIILLFKQRSIEFDKIRKEMSDRT